uniref:Pericentrin/AKAP-450 centrosomal targeting domain-containing protein n=1 Tax=Sarcophilus harrisii TaxID=9305 RepID=A0A7N4PLU9_SARHA
MEAYERDERRRKVEAGRAKLAQFRQRRTKSDGAGPKKKASKRKNATVHAAVEEKEEECAVASPGAELPLDLEQRMASGAGSEAAEGDSGSSLGVDPSVPEVPKPQGEMKVLEEKPKGKQDDADLPSQQAAELPPWLARCSEASQLQQNSEFLKSKMPVKGGPLQPQPLAPVSPQYPLEPSAPLQDPCHSTPLQLQYHRAQDLETQIAANQQNIKDKKEISAEMEEHLKSAVEELSWVVREKEGLSSGVRDPLHLVDEASVSPECAVSVKDAEVRLLNQEKREWVEESQEHPLKEVYELPQDLKWDPGLGVTEVKQACANIVDGTYRKAGGPTRAGAPALRGPRDWEPQSLSGVNVNLNNELQELDLHQYGSCATPESQMAAFQEEGDDAEWMEEAMLEDLKRKFSPAEKHLEKAWDSKGDEEMQKLSSPVQGVNGELLQESEKSRNLQLEDVGEITSHEQERALQGAFGAQKAELERLRSKVGLQPGEPTCHELEYQNVLKRFSLESEEENRSLKFDMSEEDETIEAGPLDGEASVEGVMLEVAGDLMEKYLVCSEQDHLSVSETPEYFDIETAFQSKSERGSLGCVTDELIISFDEKMDSSDLSEGLFADPVTDMQYGSGFSRGDLWALMDKDKVYLGERCGKLNQLLIEKEMALKNFSQEIEKAEETWWEGGHSLPIEPNQEGDSSFSCAEIVPRLEEEAENPTGATADSVPDSQGLSSASAQGLLWPGMVEICPEEVERGAGKRTSDSVHLEALHSREEDRLQGQLDAHQGRSQRSAGCLGQKTTLEEALLQEVETLKAEIAIKESLFTQIVKEKNNLEKMFSKDRENLEENIFELTEKIKCLEKEQRREKIEFVAWSKLAPSEGQKPDAEIKAKDSDIMQAENNLIPPMVSLKNALADPPWQLQGEAQKASWAVEDVWSELSSRYEKQMTQLKHQQEAERAQLKREHQKEVEAVSEQMKEELGKRQHKWDEERKEQIGMIKQIHERERDREIAELVSKHQEELKQLREGLQSKHQQAMKELQQHLEAFHETEMQQAQLQAQTLHSLELEALRLSLSNMHTAQLELTQANLCKEKETALVELREMLNDKRAQEVALVQSRQQFELEHIKEQHRKEKEDMALEHQQELAALEKKLELEVEAHSQTLEALKGDWDSEKGSCLRRLEEELAQKHQAEMESVREALRAQLAEQKAELEKMAHDKAQAEAALSSLQAQHQAAMQDLRQELQLQRDQYLEDMDLKVREKQQELDTLQASYEELQAQSREEIQQLWSQLDSTRANRQELNELREQLLARASHVEQLEHLKHDFERRQQQRRSEHERELEQLRLYFEQKLRDAEDSYREDLHLLHQRLQEVREDSFLDSADVSWSVEFMEDTAEVERKAHLEQLMLQLEQHKEGIAHLRLQLEEKHKEELDALKASLEVRHKQQSMAEMQREKRQHDLDLEELRTRLTEEHRKEMIKVRLQCAQDTARQVEAEVAQRLSLALEDDHKARVAQLQSQEGRVSQLTEEVGLAQKENEDLQEKLQREVALKEEAEKKSCGLVEDHQKEIKKLREEIQQLIQRNKDKEDEWQVQRGDLSRRAEERLAALALELNGKAEREQRALREAAELRVVEMERLRDQQAADIMRLEESLRQREESRAQEEAAWQERAAQDLEAAKAQMAKELEAAMRSLREDCALELQTSQARFLEEQKEMTQKFTGKQEALFKELQEKHAGELQLQRQQTESLTTELQTQHREEIDALRASLQSQHQTQLDAHVAELQTQHREEIDALRASLQSQHQTQLDAHVAELQTQHRGEMDALKASLQSQHQTQLEARVADLQTQHRGEMDAFRTSLQSQHRAQLEARVADLQTQHRGEMDALRTSLQSQHRAQLEARVANLQTQHREDMDALRTSLQSQYRVQLEARVADLQTQHVAEMSHLEAKHLSNLDSLESGYLSEIQTMQEEHSHALEGLRVRLEEQLQAKEAEHKACLAQETEKHQRELQQAQESLRIEMTTNHIEKLKSLATELQDAHQEDLQMALHNQRCLLEEENHKALDRLGEEALRMEEQHRGALQELKDIHVAELEKQRDKAGQQLQEELARLRAQHQQEREEDARAASAMQEDAKAARQQQELLFQQEMALLKGQAQVLEQQVAQLKDTLETEKRAAEEQAEELVALEREKAQGVCQREKEALTSQLQEQSSLILQLKEKISSLNNEVAESHRELEKLQALREREHEEETNLLSLLQSDMSHTQQERKTLQETNQHLLSLFGDTLKAAIAIKNQISKRIGVCLDEDSLGRESTAMGRQEQPTQDTCQLPTDAALRGPIPPLEFDQTLPECDETLLAETDISCHVRESFFLSPGVTMECEQPIRRIYQSLGVAVDNLLEMMLDSNKQLEETRELHARFEKEFNRKNEETAGAVRQQQELMDRLNQESAAKNQLALELHKAEGLAEGYKAEKAALEESLLQKEKSEHHLAVELENLKAQFQALIQEQARLKEEQSLLLRQKEKLVVEAEEKAAGLLQEVEHLVKEQSETKQQSEKDCSTLRSQMRALELELEEQLSHNQELVQQAAEIQDLKEQIVSLDKHLRNQRQFMDEQAIEREHERDEFQQEIRKLEEQLEQQQPAKSHPWGEPHDNQSFELTPEVESLQRKLREKIDELNELVIKKELTERELSAQKDEIRNLEDANEVIRRKVYWLEDELEKQKKIGKELKQDREALQEQQMNNLIQISSLQSKLDEAKHLTPAQGSPNGDDLKEQLEAEQAALLLKEKQVLSLEEELEQLKDKLTSKNNEILQLNLELALQNSQFNASIQELSAENTDLKIQQKPMEGDQLHKGDLMTQVRHILEKLHRLIKSISSVDRDADGGKQLHLPGPLERAALTSPSQRPHGRLSRSAQGRSATDLGSPASPGPECGSVCQLWDLADDAKSHASPGWGRRQFQFDQSPDSFPSSPRGDPDYAEPLTPESCYFEERVAASNVPGQVKSRDSPPPDGGRFSREPSQESAQGSPWDGSTENGSQVDTDALETVEHFRDTILDTDASSLGSPELVRRDSTLESLPSFHLTPLSHTAGLQSPEAAWRSLALPDSSGYLGLPALPGLAASPPACKDKSQPDAGQDLKSRILEKDVQDIILTPKDLQEGRQSKTPGSEGDGLGDDISRISEFPDKLKQDSYRSGPPPSRPVAHLHKAQKSGMVQRPFKPMKDKLEMQSKQMKALLKMVCDESQQILVLSEAEASVPDQGSDRLRTPPDCFQKERQGLLEAVQALKEHLSQVSSRAGDKEPSDPVFDWGEFLQAVQEVLEKERHVLKVELQSKLCNLESGDERSLLEKLEDVVKEQGELQKRTLENLHLSDRSSLLSEIQALRAQLRMTHLQNQEKLQQLYEALTNVEDHGSKQEYQFRRQIELLEYKVEQEKGLVGDLQKTLTIEQEKGIETQKLLLAAQSAAQGLTAQMEECRRDKEAVSQSLRDAHKDIAHLRSVLGSREEDLASALDGLQAEKQKVAELQVLLEEERRQSVQKDELRSKAVEELQASLEQQRSQNGQLVVSLQHEQAEKDNLKKELQIEYSRCEALLCQERSQVGELQRSLEAERARSAELGEALSHERLVTEQLSKRAGEASSQKEAQLQHAFVRKLKEEKARGAELQALLDEARRQGLAAQKQLELEVQMHCEEMKKEKEVSGRLQASADALQKQKQELLCYVDEERAKQGRLQAELEQLQSRLKDEAGQGGQEGQGEEARGASGGGEGQERQEGEGEAGLAARVGAAASAR